MDDKPQREHVRCAVDTCGVGAFCRIKTAHGWAHFCEQHYELHFSNIARQWASGHGLTRKADEAPTAYRQRMMAHMRANAKLKTFSDATRAEDEWSAA